LIDVTADTLLVFKVKGPKPKVTWQMPTDRQSIRNI